MESQEIIARLERQNYLMEKRYEILKSMICDIYDEVIPQRKYARSVRVRLDAIFPMGHRSCVITHNVRFAWG